ncbi:DUF6008 family protein [Amycolatopsis sp. FBCC-B4732]|uniref:DUF6008 family protein n=1 Tax=Amycolatopsis sp. FBCC-B4732 TaxID=3079339 RepID=UPI001FF477C5|nr:DUF6008 family protein [Amycolatopsis sp. FBCC-B4732]UOX91950.1 DUF6008 family protein [Amycolatopsis sp. FBCC-B4732]
MDMPMTGMSGWDTAGAVLIVLWALAMWAAVGVLAYANRGPVRPWVYRGSAAVIGIGVLGQLGHVQEHIAQVGYWLGHPNSPAWMTPWGTGLANGLQMVLPDRPTFGMELLHLTGNFIFLAGLAGVMVITRRALKTRARRWAKMGVWMQGLHGLEHLVLTLSVAFGSRAIGLSTFFGLVGPGPGLTTYRVWWHFVANVAGSIIFGLALYHLGKERREVRATFFVRPLPEVTRRAA